MSLLSVKLSIKTYMDFLMKTDNHLQTINIVVLKSDIPTAPFTFIVWFQGAKDDYQKCCWILSCIHQMRECFSWIVVTSQTLSESEPCWYAIDDGPDYEVLFHALTRIWKVVFNLIFHGIFTNFLKNTSFMSIWKNSSFLF